MMTSRLHVSIVVGLALGVMVLWAGAAPSTNGHGLAGLLVGGDWTAGGACCDGTGADDCESGWDPVSQTYPCDGGSTNICDNPGTADNNCGPSGYENQCYWDDSKAQDPGWDICENTYDSECSNDPV